MKHHHFSNSSQDDEFTARVVVPAIRIDVGEVLDWVEGNFEPEEVYAEKDLIAWSKSNGWTKKE